MPPMPVTFFILIVCLFCFVMIDLNAKPQRKDAVITKTMNDAFFILAECL
jgi:hypothetical protein